MSARRQRPAFSLRDIDPSIVDPPFSGGGVAAAGLGAGRPSLPDPPRRPPAGDFGSPFSNFSKIVYVLSFNILQPLIFFSPLSQRPFRCSQF